MRASLSDPTICHTHVPVSLSPSLGGWEEGGSRGILKGKPNRHTLTIAPGISMSTYHDDINAAVQCVHQQKQAWARLPLAHRLSLLRSILDLLEEHVDEYVNLIREARGGKRKKGVSERECAHVSGDAYAVGPSVFGSLLNTLIATYESLIASGKPPPPISIRTRLDGQHVVQVFPRSLIDTAFAPGCSAELFIQKDREPTQGASLTNQQEGAVVCILAPGNYDAPLDVFTKMFMEGKVCVYKANPAAKNVWRALEKICAPLVQDDFLRFVVGDVDAGKALVHHELVDELLMTGGSDTYDRIMWGSPQETPTNKLAKTPKITKRFDAELGNVSPFIIVPGNWSRAALEHHAQHLAWAKTMNSGYVCSSPQVILIKEDWPQRSLFMKLLRDALKEIPRRPAYYPGTSARHARFQAEHPRGELITTHPKGHIFENEQDVYLISSLKPGSFATRNEAFCLVLAEMPLAAQTTREFLFRAVETCNKELWGTLAATIICDDPTRVELGEAFHDAIAQLRYGSIGVNMWVGMNVYHVILPWGAFPGHTSDDIQSGMGQVSNAHLYDHVEKAVHYSPFVSVIHTPSSPNVLQLNARMAQFSIRKGWWNYTRMIVAKVLGV